LDLYSHTRPHGGEVVSNGRKWLSWSRQTISCETINILHKHSFEYCDLSAGAIEVEQRKRGRNSMVQGLTIFVGFEYWGEFRADPEKDGASTGYTT